MTLAILIYLVLGGLVSMSAFILCSETLFEDGLEKYLEEFEDKPIKKVLWALITSALILICWFPVLIWVVVKVIKD